MKKLLSDHDKLICLNLPVSTILKRLCVFGLGATLMSTSFAEKIEIELMVPELDVPTYHQPYVAIWLETTDRKGVETLAVWQEQDIRLKDIRQWWRKIGRNGEPSYDGVTGATRKPGAYQVVWDSEQSQAEIPAGEYYLCLEAAREAGGRDFFKQKIQLGADEAQQFRIPGKLELGDIQLTITP